MFNKKGIIFIVLVSFLLMMGMNIPAKDTSEITPLIEAFEKSNAELTQYSFHLGIPYQPIKEEHLQEKGEELSRLFHVPAGKVERFGNEPFYIATGDWGNGTKIEIQLKNILENPTTYLVMKVVGTNSSENIVTDYQKFRNLLQLAHINPKINSCIQGNINDKLSNVEQKNLIQDLLKTVDANRVEALDTELVTSVSAYSPKFGQVIQTGGGSMNLQVATHYSSLHKKTILTMGTPIITVEY